MKTKHARTFSGSEIKTALVAAIEALPDHIDIVEVSAGENMPIRFTVTSDTWPDRHLMFGDWHWDGERWKGGLLG